MFGFFSNETDDYTVGRKDVVSGLVKAIGGQTGLFLDSQGTDVPQLGNFVVP